MVITVYSAEFKFFFFSLSLSDFSTARDHVFFFSFPLSFSLVEGMGPGRSLQTRRKQKVSELRRPCCTFVQGDVGCIPSEKRKRNRVRQSVLDGFGLFNGMRVLFCTEICYHDTIDAMYAGVLHALYGVETVFKVRLAQLYKYAHTHIYDIEMHMILISLVEQFPIVHKV